MNHFSNRPMSRAHKVPILLIVGGGILLFMGKTFLGVVLLVFGITMKKSGPSKRVTKKMDQRIFEDAQHYNIQVPHKDSKVLPLLRQVYSRWNRDKDRHPFLAEQLDLVIQNMWETLATLEEAHEWRTNLYYVLNSWPAGYDPNPSSKLKQSIEDARESHRTWSQAQKEAWTT